MKEETSTFFAGEQFTEDALRQYRMLKVAGSMPATLSKVQVIEHARTKLRDRAFRRVYRDIEDIHVVLKNKDQTISDYGGLEGDILRLERRWVEEDLRQGGRAGDEGGEDDDD